MSQQEAGLQQMTNVWMVKIVLRVAAPANYMGIKLGTTPALPI